MTRSGSKTEMEQPPHLYQAMARIGQVLGLDVLETCRAMFSAEQEALSASVPAAACDLAYGPHERHGLDLYGEAGGALKPVLLFVHGGAFVGGDKGNPSDPKLWHNGSVGRMAARRGWIGAVMNYRLAPHHQWPAGAEDVGMAVDFLRAHAANYGGDPDRILIIGTSAGAAHVGGFLQLRPDHTFLVHGFVLLSGLYGITPLEPKDEQYYGAAETYADKSPLEALASTKLPMMMACTQYDPERFQAEYLGLLQQRLACHRTIPRSMIVSGHNHYTMAMHLGTSDRRLEDNIIEFARNCVTL